MIKRKFGMACLNISQGRFNSFSHAQFNAYDLAGMDSGIDRFKTFNDLTVIGVHKFNYTTKSGFANTVHFYDAENDVTLAMTHCNNISNCTVGKVFKSGETIYYEGTTGNATGNHIHLEIGMGYQTDKTKFDGGWRLNNWIDIEDYFYIDPDYTTVKDSKAYDFQMGLKVELAKGYQTVTYKSQTIHVYVPDSMEIGMISATGEPSYMATNDITKMDANKLIYCKVNANYFEMSDKSIYGLHYGVEQSFTNDLAPKQKEWLYYTVKNDGSVEYGSSDNYWLTKADVKFACSPAVIYSASGSMISTAAGDKREVSNTQTLLINIGTEFALAVVSGSLTPNQCWDWAQLFGATNIAVMDSGGSSQMIVNGYKKVYTGRKLPNVLCFYKPLADETTDQADSFPTGDSETETPTDSTAEDNTPQEDTDTPVTPSTSDSGASGDTNTDTGTSTDSSAESSTTEPADTSTEESASSGLMALLKMLYELLKKLFEK